MDRMEHLTQLLVNSDTRKVCHHSKCIKEHLQANLIQDLSMRSLTSQPMIMASIEMWRHREHAERKGFAVDAARCGPEPLLARACKRAIA
mmetsp:Transcript_113873/g.179237  ORF Transcript_113873/g.179237 Transcript_113873/m.179237 type:complete len:90 (+) Transcript_113873:663-932(+)